MACFRREVLLHILQFGGIFGSGFRDLGFSFSGVGVSVSGRGLGLPSRVGGQEEYQDLGSQALLGCDMCVSVCMCFGIWAICVLITQVRRVNTNSH